jgi:hypothetical protein
LRVDTTVVETNIHFPTDTDLIKRGKARQPVEFGHKVFLAESAHGLITDYQVLNGNPADTTQVRASLERHQQVFHCAPDLFEGRISVLFRGRGMKRCRAQGRDRFEVLVGAAVLANNLLRIAEMLRDAKPARAKKAA